jgi:hypothetical protein
MHWVIAVRRQMVDDHFGRAARRHAVSGDRVTRDALADCIAFLGVERAFIEPDSGATTVVLGRIRAKTANDVRFPVVVGVAKCDQKTAGVRRSLVIRSAPGVNVDIAFELTAMCRTWPRVSANTTAQNPAGSVMPPLSLAHAVLEAVVVEVRVLSDDRLLSPLLHATNASRATLLIKRNAYMGLFRKG